MVDKEMLMAMSEMMEQKLEQVLEQKLEPKLEQVLEQKLEQILDRKLEPKLEQILDQKLDEKLEPVYNRLDKLESDMQYVKVVQLENNVIPRLNTIEAYYVDTAKRYQERAEQIDAMSSDIEIMKIVLEEHSEKLNRISV